jgi:hypothetical protein
MIPACFGPIFKIAATLQPQLLCSIGLILAALLFIDPQLSVTSLFFILVTAALQHSRTCWTPALSNSSLSRCRISKFSPAISDRYRWARARGCFYSSARETWASLFQGYGRSQSRQTQVGYPIGDVRTSAAALDPAESKKFYLDPRRGRQSRDLHPVTGSEVLHKLAMVVVHDRALSDSSAAP